MARTLNLIAGDGETNVLHLNTLDYERWSDNTERDSRWVLTYGDGFNRLKALRTETEGNKFFNFDILMANPPFAGDIKERRILHQYTLGFKEDGKAQSKVGRDILFIERNLDFLRPGGRMAIVLPQGRFNNTSDRHIRKFIAETRPHFSNRRTTSLTLSNPTPAPKRAFYSCRNGTTIQTKDRFVREIMLAITQSFLLFPKKAARIIRAITFFSTNWTKKTVI